MNAASLLLPLFLTPLGLACLEPVLAPPLQDAPGDAVEEPPGPAVIESTTCQRCHSNAETATAMRDADGVGIAAFDLWSGTMMANAARDPLWRAAVAHEVAGTPSRKDDIERTCLSCHAPMATQVGIGDYPDVGAMHVLDVESRTGDLARDGVSCTICHGITPEGLGTPESYTAGYVLDPWRRMFGPHADPFAMPMRRMAGFTPTEGHHILESSHCGSCHTLETEALDADGHELGPVLLEQAPYLEWRNSVFTTEGGEPGPEAASCQDCHAPTRDAEGREYETRIVRNPGGRNFPPTSPRKPFGSHRFVGGNTMVLTMLRDHADELGATASPDSFTAAIDATRAQLAHQSASLEVIDVRHTGGWLEFDVRIENLTGHKLPSAHPTRRVWLHAELRDAAGATLFASGSFDERGRILGSDGLPLASEAAGGPVQPHRDRIEGGDQVALYRALMADIDGNPTHLLLRGASYLVDDRLLPRGWKSDGPDAERTAPAGFEDDDFVGGSDVVTYAVELPAVTAGGLVIELELLHQSLSARWAAEILSSEGDDIRRFEKLYETANPKPNTMGRVVYQLRQGR